jgi:hypothetical protein
LPHCLRETIEGITKYNMEYETWKAKMALLLISPGYPLYNVAKDDLQYIYKLLIMEGIKWLEVSQMSRDPIYSIGVIKCEKEGEVR